MKHLLIFKSLRLLLVAVIVAALAWTAWPASPVYAATITVNTTADDTLVNGNCTLREAIIAANIDAAVDACPAGSGADTIDLPAGTYLLTIPGTSETDGLTGDLNINSDLTITGAGWASTTIDANGLDRVFRTDRTITVQISGVTIQGGNPGSIAGGNVLVTGDSVLTLTDSRVRNAAANAGIWVNSKLILINSRIHGNVYSGILVNGSNSTAVILNSTISGNTNVGSGGGISNLFGTLTIVNSTISGNTADVDGAGIFSRGTTRLYNVTISNNTDTATFGGSGGGVNIDSGTFTARDSIIAGNFVTGLGSAPDCSGTLTSEGYNLIENTTGCTIAGVTTGNITGLSANLGPLQNNGGPTMTHALLAGSPAIEGGDPANWCVDQDNNLLNTDQRGYVRNGLCDIGAYEYLSVGTPTPSSTPTASATASATPLATNTPTNTPTPNPTAMPIVVNSALASLNPTDAANVDFNVIFSKPVTGVDATDFILTSSGLSGASVTAVSGSGTSYVVSAGTGTGSGTLRLDITDDDSILDSASNPLGGAGAGNGDFTFGESYSVRLATFDDVPTTYWDWQWIERLYNAGITGGCGVSPLIYCPDSSVTRAQMAVFLLRGIHGSSYTPPAPTGNIFTDIPVSHWAAAWIEQLYAEGITGGCGVGLYCPDDPVTRAQMAVFLLRAEHGSSYAPPAISATQFTDVPLSYWDATWIEQLAVEGITGGCGVGLYCPDDPVTRAQMAVFLVKTFNLP